MYMWVERASLYGCGCCVRALLLVNECFACVHKHIGSGIVMVNVVGNGQGGPRSIPGRTAYSLWKRTNLFFSDEENNKADWAL